MDNHSIEAQGQFDIKKPRVWQVGFLYSLVVILLVFVSTKLQEALQFNIGGLLSEVLLVMLPPGFPVYIQVRCQKGTKIEQDKFYKLCFNFWDYDIWHSNCRCV